MFKSSGFHPPFKRGTVFVNQVLLGTSIIQQIKWELLFFNQRWWVGAES